MKYTAKKLNDDSWAVFTGKQYFTDTVTQEESKAKERALIMSAHWHQEQMDDIHNKLEKMGVIDSQDPHGYLA